MRLPFFPALSTALSPGLAAGHGAALPAAAIALPPAHTPGHSPGHSPGRAERCAVLLCNLGTPDAPTAPAVRRYLAQFLRDPRVVEIPRLLWLPILHGLVLRTQPARSAARYQSIWSAAGSPLALWSARQARLLHDALGPAGIDCAGAQGTGTVLVRHAMRYGQPSIAGALDALRSQGATRILIVALYPQYSACTTASVFDAVSAWATRTRDLPELRFVRHYHDHPAYIDALAQTIDAHWRAHGRPDQLLLSYHGLPERSLRLGDPYHGQTLRTAHLLAARLGLSADRYRISYQSRFGRAAWIAPYTRETLEALARAGQRRVDVVCPGFASDCLETLHEVDIELRAAFMQAGGREFHYIACLNDSPAWIAALRTLVQQHLAGWQSR